MGSLLALGLLAWLGSGIDASGPGSASPLAARQRAARPLAARPLAADAPIRPPTLVGLNMDLLSLDAEAAAEAIAEARRLGLRRIRLPLNWSEIEPNRGKFDWGRLDEVLDLLAKADIELLLSLQSSPAWARRDPPPPSHYWICDEPTAVDPKLARFAPPTDPQDFARFVDALVSRHAARIAAIELWHEPNILPNWRKSGPDAEDYGRLILAAAPRIRAKAPGILLVSAGLAPVVIDASPVCYMSDLVFLDRLAGAAGAPLEQVDAIGLAALGFGQSPEVEPWEDGLNFRRVELATERLRAQGINKPIWGLSWARYDPPVSGEGQGFEGFKGAGPAAPTASMASAPNLELDWLRASWQRNASSVEAGTAGFSRLYLGLPARGAAAQVSGTSALLPAGQSGRAAGMDDRLLAPLLDPESGLEAAGAKGARVTPPSVVVDSAIDRFSLVEDRAAPILAILALIAGSLAWILAKGKARRRSGSAARTVDQGQSIASGRAAGKPRLAKFKSGLQRLTEGLAGRSDASLALLYGLCIGLNAFGPQPFSLLALIPMAIVALARPPLALAAVAAALPFHYALRMKLGPQPVAIVEILLGLAIAGRILWAWLRVPMPDVARVEPSPVNTGPDAAGPDAAGPDAAGPDAAGPDAAGPDAAGPDAAGLKKSGRSHLLWSWSLWSGMPGLDRLALLLVLWSGLSPLWAPRPTHAIYEWRTVMLEPALFYLLLRIWPDRRAAARLALDGLILGAFLASTMALAGLAIIAGGGQAGWATAVEAEGVFRARGPYGSPNNLALYLGRVLPLLVAGLIWHRGPRRRLEALALLPVAAALLASFSRGSIVLGLPALAVYGLLLAGGRMRRALTWLSLSGLALVLLILPFADSERVRGTFSLRPGTTAYYRLRLWQSAWRMIQDHPWLGVGLDNFLYLYRDRYVQRDVVQERGLSHPHNLVLDAWTRLGLPGLLILLLLVIGNLRAGIRAIAATAKRAGADHAMVVGALGMQIYGLAHGLIDNSFFLVDLAAMWWIAQAALMALGAAPEATAASAPEDGSARRFALRDMAEEPAA